MKNLITNLICSAILILSIESCGEMSNNDINDLSTKKYIVEVKIGNQNWMAENLNVDKFRNGEPIPEVRSNKEWETFSQSKKAAWCYYDYKSSNGVKYGKLYNWYAVNDPRGLAPIGWHIPSDDEWFQLTKFLGGDDVAGKKMKSKSGWAENGNGSNESGFSGLPGGSSTNSYDNVGNEAYWWSSTVYNYNLKTYGVWGRSLSCFYDSFNRQSYNEDMGLSVRCIRD